MTKIAKAWNQPPVAALNTWQARITASDVAKYLAWFIFLTLASCFVATSQITRESSNKWVSIGYYAMVLLAYAAAAFFGLSTLKLALLVPPTRRKPPQWVRGLTQGQLSLLGLQGVMAAPPAAPVAADGKAAAAKPPAMSPLGPPKRTPPIPAPPTASPALGATPPPPAWSPARASPSTYGRGVSTPSHLAPILDDFERQAQPPQPAPELGYGAHLSTPPAPFTGLTNCPTPTAAAPYAAVSPYAGASPAGGTSGFAFGSMARGAGGVSGSPLPAAASGGGGGAPPFRSAYSSMGGGMASLVVADGRLPLAAADQLGGVMAQLEMDRDTLETWIERLREWFAGSLLQPLVRAVERAAEDVVEAAAALSWGRLQLSPLGSANGAAREADDEVLIMQMREALLHRLRTQPHVQAAETGTCLQAVINYQRLALLLRGESPRALLPPAPRGYIAARVRTLAAGPCVSAFAWNSGGAWEGRPWSAELPSDSALMLYLFAAYLEAPDWRFLIDGPRLDLAANPLYLGALPTRPAAGYYALLPARPPPTPPAAAAVLGLGLGSNAPSFGLVLDGELGALLTSGSAMFASLLLFLRVVQRRGGGSLGGRSLGVLGLEGVLAQVPPSYSLFGDRWFGLF